MTASIPEQVQRIFDRCPFVTDLGIKLESLGHGECTTVLDLEPRHLQQDGFAHAGVHATMADHTAGAAAASLARPGQIVLGAGFSIALLRAAKGQRLICRARVLKPGRLTVVEAEVFCLASAEERMVSKATVSIAVVEPRGV